MLSLLVLILFSSLVIWHDKPATILTGDETRGFIKTVIQLNPGFRNLLGQLGPQEEGFYLIGLVNQVDWPRSFTQACYIDPILSSAPFSFMRQQYAEKSIVIRYRSLDEFLLLLKNREARSPGYISSLEMKSYVLMPENPYALSMRSMLAVLSAMMGLIMVWLFRKKV